MRSLKFYQSLLSLFFLFALAQAQEAPQTLLGETIPCETPEPLGCIILGSKLEGEHVIRNNAEYQALLEEARNPFSSNCINHKLPPIDFTEHTLIGYISSIGGCGFPTVTHQINKLNENYEVNIQITRHGMCERNNPIQLWCLVPRIPAHAQVNFEIETTINW